MAMTMAPEAGLYRLMAWLSPAYPVGAFSHSSGLEWAVEAGWVHDRDSLTEWLADLLRNGSVWSDAVLFIHGHRAVAAGDQTRLAAVAELAAALAPARERQVETLAQGMAFVLASEAAWDCPALALLRRAAGARIAYPVAVAALAAGWAIAAGPALTAYLHGVVANLVSAAQRLVPLGQSDGQRAIAILEAAVDHSTRRALALDHGDPFGQVGGAGFAADIAALRHETQYTRLFRS